MENDKLKDPARRPGTVDVTHELGKTVFGAFIAIEPQEQRTLTFKYRLSPQVVAMINSGNYLLDVEKQPGTISHGLTVDLEFDKTLRGAVPSEDRIEFGDSAYRYTTDLRIDRVFQIEF